MRCRLPRVVVISALSHLVRALEFEAVLVGSVSLAAALRASAVSNPREWHSRGQWLE